MSDIVERLRAAASHPRNQHGPHEFLTDAADEIARLRAALRDIHAAAGNNHLIANIARAALGEKP